MRVLSKQDALRALERVRRELDVTDTGCVMCAVFRQAQDSLIFETEAGRVLLDRFGNRFGHLLIISRQHVERGTQLGWQQYRDLQRLAFDASCALEAVLNPARVYVAALGSSEPISTSYPHYHIHVVPIAEHDEDARPARVFSWSTGIIQYDEEEARQLVARLRAAWPQGA